MDQYFKRIDFKKYKESLGLEAAIEEEWTKQPNGVLVKPLISEEESIAHNITYIGLIFPKPTDGHKYKTQTDTIHFKEDGKVEFSLEGNAEKREVYLFSVGDAIQIIPQIVRKIIPIERQLEIELIVQPKFNLDDEIHVYD